jgi:hypothetical protein
MDSKSFLKALQLIVREEVQKAVRTEVKKLLAEQSSQHVVDHGIRMNTQAIPKKKSNKTFSKDPLLNDLLAETAASPSAVANDWPVMDFQAEMAQGFGMMRSAGPDIPHARAVAPSHDISGNPVNINNENVATVVNAMTKDYSALMKAIDKKKGVR